MRTRGNLRSYTQYACAPKPHAARHGGPVVQRAHVSLLSCCTPAQTCPHRQVSGGFLEGIVRGYKAGLLTQNQYNNLTQCETIEGAPAFPEYMWRCG